MRKLEIPLHAHGVPVGVLQWEGADDDVGGVVSVDYPDPDLLAWIQEALEHNFADSPVGMLGGLLPDRPSRYLECVLQILDRAAERQPSFSFVAPEIRGEGDVR